jgi:hypothetical protein
MKSKVYVVMDVKGKNLLPARDYGELHILLTGEESNEQAFIKLEDSLLYMDKTDYILLIGHPIFIAMTSAVAFSYFNTIKFLVWERDKYKYKVEVLEYKYEQSTDPATDRQ